MTIVRYLNDKSQKINGLLQSQSVTFDHLSSKRFKELFETEFGRFSYLEIKRKLID